MLIHPVFDFDDQHGYRYLVCQNSCMIDEIHGFEWAYR